MAQHVLFVIQGICCSGLVKMWLYVLTAPHTFTGKCMSRVTCTIECAYTYNAIEI